MDAEWQTWRKDVDIWRKDVDQRLTKIETILEHVASKTDLANLKIWMLSSILGGVLGAVGLAKLVL